MKCLLFLMSIFDGFINLLYTTINNKTQTHVKDMQIGCVYTDSKICIIYAQ